MKKEEILEQAKKLISNNREEQHGDAYKNHSQISDLWSVFLDDKLKPFKEISPGDVALMMVLVKISRSTMGEFNKDDYLDGSAYMAIAGELNDPDNILGQEKDEGTIRGEKTLAYIKKFNKEKK
jgi:hypothetical protein|tara:strand:+ start:2175 stop:2546 length:372 start_codon:yes stop_codon:yes gene_type:complete